MKTTCLINNFNYKDYVCEAINSALAQTHPFDEIIVVDDASTDGSGEMLQKLYNQIPNVKIIIHQKNQGQLAATNTGFEQSTGDILFFLDADDFYHEKYLEIALEVYHKYPNCGFLYSKMGIFNHLEQDYKAPSKEQIEQFRNYIMDCGYSIILTLQEMRFVGSPTSANSIRRKYLSEILPCNYIGDYKMPSDTCIVFGASILGAQKFYIDLPLIAYRRHDKNDSNNSYINNRLKFYQSQVALMRLFKFLSQKINLDISLISRNAPFEFKTVEHPNWNLFFAYLKIVLRNNSGVPCTPVWMPSKLYGLAIMLKHMLSS